MTRMGKGEKTAKTEGILAKTVWVGTSWNWEGKTARTEGQTRLIWEGKPPGTCGENWPEPRVGEISQKGWEADQKWEEKMARTGTGKMTRPGENLPPCAQGSAWEPEGALPVVLLWDLPHALTFGLQLKVAA